MFGAILPTAVGAALLAASAIAVVVGTARRRQAGAATGSLSRQTVAVDHRRAARPDHTRVERRAVELRDARELERSGAIEPRPASHTERWSPPDPETYDITRRKFLNRTIVGVFGLSAASFAGSILAFLWPTGTGGFGGVITVGKISDIVADIRKDSGFLYEPAGRLWLTEYPATALPKGRQAYAGEACLPGMEAGVVALYQKCPHLGCRVPACLTSQWFECPCHGSQYNQVGEKKGGPAPRGMDRFPVEVAKDGTVKIDTSSSKIILGPRIGTNTTGQEAEGPHCV